MDKATFEAQFREQIIVPLSAVGFKEQGRSLYLIDGDIAVSLIRHGGRMSRPGCVSQTLCFRHAFLDDVDGEPLVGFVKNASSYPIKLRPSSLFGVFPKRIKYVASNLGFESEIYSYSNKREKEVVRYLKNLLRSVSRITAWAHKLEPVELAKQIRKNGEGAWIERNWLRSYAEHDAVRQKES